MGGGLLVHGGSLSVSGSPVVRDNVAEGGTTSDIYLCSGKSVAVPEAISDGAILGITVQTPPSDGAPVAVTTANAADFSKYFFSDSVRYVVANGDDNTVYLQAAPSYVVAIAESENGSVAASVSWWRRPPGRLCRLRGFGAIP